MEAKFKVGDVVKDVSGQMSPGDGGIVAAVDGEMVRICWDGDFCTFEEAAKENHWWSQDDFVLVKSAQPAITIGSTWYWQGEKDSPVTVIGFDSKGRVVVESGFEDGDDPTYLGEVFAYGGKTDLEGPEQFLAAYQPTAKEENVKLTGYVRVLKPAKLGPFSEKTGPERIFQSAVFSDEAKARAAVPYGFEIIDVVKVEWSEE